jgi:hypothetical protein
MAKETSTTTTTTNHPRWLKALHLTRRIPPFTLFVTAFLATAIIFLSFVPHRRSNSTTPTGITTGIPASSPKFTSAIEHQGPGQIKRCTAPRPNSWAELDEALSEQAVRILKRRGREVGIGEGADVVFVERLMPNKTDVLGVVGEGEGEGEVERWARVVVVEREAWGARSGASGGLSEWMVSSFFFGMGEGKTDILADLVRLVRFLRGLRR